VTEVEGGFKTLDANGFFLGNSYLTAQSGCAIETQMVRKNGLEGKRKKDQGQLVG